MKIPDYKQLIGVSQLSREQKLLLQATVLQGEPALYAWQQWKESVDIEILDPASNALLCQLYCNLAAHQVEDFHMARLKGIYKRHWYGNQLLLKKLQTILQALQEAEIDTIVLGDAAIVAGYYKESNQRPINELNLLIHPADREKAIAILNRLGWDRVDRSDSIIDEENLYLQLQDKSKTKLHLLGQLFWAIPQEYTEKQLWANATPSQIGNTNILILSINDLLLHLCSRCFDLDRVQNINLLADVMTILKQQKAEINWIELVTQAQRYQTILPLRNMLTLLRQLFGLSTPDWVLYALHQMPVARKEFLQYQILSHAKRTILKSILFRTTNMAKLK